MRKGGEQDAVILFNLYSVSQRKKEGIEVAWGRGGEAST